MKKMLIATDFDGTLNRDGGIEGVTRKAIDDWRAAGRLFGVVTGRGIDFFDTAKDIELPFDYLIICNGSLIISPEKEVIYESLIPAETFAEVERFLSCFKDIEYYSNADGKPRHHFYATFPSAERALSVREKLISAFGDSISVFVNGPHINIGNRGTGKADGVKIILRHFSLPEGSAAVVGDDYNDLEMILAHDGWAVDSGKPEVVEKSPHVCSSVGDLIRKLMCE